MTALRKPMTAADLFARDLPRHCYTCSRDTAGKYIVSVWKHGDVRPRAYGTGLTQEAAMGRAFDATLEFEAMRAKLLNCPRCNGLGSYIAHGVGRQQCFHEGAKQ